MNITRYIMSICLCFITLTCATPTNFTEATTKALGAWIDAHRTLVNTMLGHNVALADYRTTHQQNIENLKKLGVKTYGRANYIFEVENIPGYLIKISALPLRIHNILSAYGYTAGAIQTIGTTTDLELKKKLCAQLSQIPTYQTASSLNTYRQYCAFIEIFPLKHVIMPATFGVRLSATHPMHDQNCIILQEKIDLVDEKTELTLRKNISPEQLQELVTLVFACGLWDMTSNIKFDQAGHVVVVDLEQPDMSNPLKGFNQYDRRQWRANVQTAITELITLFDGDTCRQKLIQIYAEPFFKQLD